MLKANLNMNKSDVFLQSTAKHGHNWRKYKHNLIYLEFVKYYR